MTILQMHNVTRHFSDKPSALSEVNFEMNSGDVVGLVGCNGAGKSTFLKLALGLISPTEGSVKTLGLDPKTDALEVRKKVGYSADDRDSKSTARIGEMLELHQALFPTWDEQFATRLLGGLAAESHQRIDKLSQGQARRVLLSCAMAHRPQLLLLDEPANGLDPSVRREFLELTIELMSEAGTSVVLSSHHLADVERIANRVVILDQGRILVDATADELRENYCLAHFDGTAGGVGERLAGIDDVVNIRLRGERSVAVFRTGPAELHDKLLRINVDADCRHANLEDLFIALVGETS